MANIRDSLSHTKWLCKYHIVFTPKYRRKAIYGQYKESIGKILRQLCNYKGVEIIEGHLMPDHIHMLVSIPPKYSVSQIMGYLKGQSSLLIFDSGSVIFGDLILFTSMMSFVLRRCHSSCFFRRTMFLYSLFMMRPFMTWSFMMMMRK